MSTTIAEAQIEIGADTRKLQEALKRFGDQMKTGFKVSLDTSVADKQIKKLQEDLKKATANQQLTPNVPGAATVTPPSAALGSQTRLTDIAVAGSIVTENNKISKSISKTNLTIKEQIDLLRQQIPTTSEIGKRLEVYRTEQFKNDAVIERSVKSLEKFEIKTTKTANATKQLTSQTQKATVENKKSTEELNKKTNALKNNKNQISNLSPALASLISKFQQLGPAGVVGAALTVFVKFTRASISAADAIDNLSGQFNLSIRDVQTLSVLAQDAGVSFNELGQVVNRLNLSRVRALSGDDANIKIWDDLGISLDKIKNLTPAELFEVFGQKLNESSISARENAAILQLLGETGVRTRKIIRQLGEEGFDVLGEKLEKNNQILNGGVVAFGDIVEQRITNKTRALKNIGATIGNVSSIVLDELLSKNVGSAISNPFLFYARVLPNYVKTSNEAKEKLLQNDQDIIDSSTVAGDSYFKRYRDMLINRFGEILKVARDAYEKIQEEQRKAEEKRLRELEEANQRERKILQDQIDYNTIIIDYSEELINNKDRQIEQEQSLLEKLQSQLSVLERFKSTLSTTDASGFLDLFQQSVFNPAVTREEFNEAGRPQAASFTAIERMISSTNLIIDKLGAEIQFIGDNISRLSDNINNLSGAINNIPTGLVD